MAVILPSGFEFFGVALVFLIASALWATVKVVPQGYNWTVESFGRYTRTLTPGLHILVPVSLYRTPAHSSLPRPP